MVIKEISVSVSRTIQLQEFKPFKAEVGAVATLAKGEDHAEKIKELFTICKGQVTDQISLAIKIMNERLKSL